MRWMRSRIRLNAARARRISVAPSTLKSSVSRPLPNESTAAASRRIGLTWFRMNTVATANSTNEVPTIHITNMYVVGLNSRSVGTQRSSTPSGICTRVPTREIRRLARQLVAAREFDPHAEIGRGVQHPALVLGAGKLAHGVHDQLGLARHRAGQPPRDGLPIPGVEQPG